MDDATTAPRNGRHPDGRFGPGNSISKGNAVARRQHELKVALLDAVDDGTLGQVVAVLVAAAKGGDVMAIKLLLDHCVGRPTQAVELSGVDGEPLGLDWSQVQAAILASLDGHPAARIAVAAGLKGIVDAGRTRLSEDASRPGRDDGRVGV